MTNFYIFKRIKHFFFLQLLILILKKSVTNTRMDIFFILYQYFYYQLFWKHKFPSSLLCNYPQSRMINTYLQIQSVCIWYNIEYIIVPHGIKNNHSFLSITKQVWLNKILTCQTSAAQKDCAGLATGACVS